MATKIRGYLTPKNIIRNQYLFKEGEKADFVYIIEKGQFQVTKNIYTSKQKNLDVELLTKSTKTTKRYSSNFKGQIGFKKDLELKLLMVSADRMIGDFEGLKKT